MEEAGEDVEVETEEEEEAGPVPFQLQFDKPIPSQVEIAEWNPEKDLLAMVTEDSKVLLHRFNWQRLWTISPGKCITSLCWRPDGKAIALGLEDGFVSLHDVENGKLLRSFKSHNVSVICLNWEEDTQIVKEGNNGSFTFEDRTMRFFPPAPRIPRFSGLGSGDTGLMDDIDDSFQEMSNSSRQRFNILCSGDKDGCICFSIFGIFPIGKINIRELSISCEFLGGITTCQLLNASIHKVALSEGLCQLVVLSFGKLVEVGLKSNGKSLSRHEVDDLKESLWQDDSSEGLYCLVLNTSIFLNRKHELHQVAQQASSIGDLVEVVRASLSVMSKQWSAAMQTFHKKFDALSPLIVNHGLDSSPQEEFLSLLFGSRRSTPLHQFLVNSLGEVGMKRVAKAVDSAGKELHLVARENLQPAVEMIVFRIGELRGLSRWRARYQHIGLDEKLIDNATEKAGMLLVQVERFLRVLAIVMYQFHNFFTWVLRCIKILLSEPTDQIQPPNSELVVIFLKFILNHDPVGQLLESSDLYQNIEGNLEAIQRTEQLVSFGGFLDTKYLQRTLAKEFSLLEQCVNEAFSVPFNTISKKIQAEGILPIYPVPSSSFSHATTSIGYKDDNEDTSECSTSRSSLVDYICVRMPDESVELGNCIGILRGFASDLNSMKSEAKSLDAVLLSIPQGYHCVDLSFYKDNQIVLLLKEATSTSEIPGRSWMMMLHAKDLPFCSIPRSTTLDGFWKLKALKASAVVLQLGNGKVRSIPHSVAAPLAVSASRGLACVFSSRRHALVYILDEDEDDVVDSE